MVRNQFRVTGEARRVRITWRSALLATVILILAALGSSAAGLWRLVGSEQTTSQTTVRFTTEMEEGLQGGKAGNVRGVVNSPLRVTISVPSTTDGSFDTALGSVSLELLDVQGNPAYFGEQTYGSLAMRPTTTLGSWEYTGSVPSRPGNYHARARLVKLSNTSDVELFESTDVRLEAISETGSALVTGYLVSQDADIWLMSTDTSRQRRLTYVSLQGGLATRPAWSPDGSQIAFTYQPPLSPTEFPVSDIWVMNADGSDGREIVKHGASETLGDVSWSSDGRYLYFTVEAILESNSIEGTSGGSFIRTRSIDMLELATGIRSRLTEAAQMPTTGPGAELAYIEETGGDAAGQLPGNRITLSKPSGPDTGNSLDGRARNVLVKENGSQRIYAPRISPDGKWVVYATTVAPPSSSSDFDPLGWLFFSPRTAYAHGDPWDLFIVSSAGGSPSRLTNLNEDEPYAVWTSNADIAFMGITGLRTLQLDSTGRPLAEPQSIHEGEAVHGGLSWRGP